MDLYLKVLASIRSQTQQRTPGHVLKKNTTDTTFFFGELLISAFKIDHEKELAYVYKLQRVTQSASNNYCRAGHRVECPKELEQSFLGRSGAPSRV